MLLLLRALPGLSQGGKVWADSVLTDLATHKQNDAHRAAGLARSIMPEIDRQGDPCRSMHVRLLLSNYLDRLGAVDSALAVFMDDRFAGLDRCDGAVQKDYYRFITNVYLSVGDLDRVDSLSKVCYAKARTGAMATVDLAEVRNNHAIALASKGQLDEALQVFQAIHDEARARGHTDNMIQSLLNMATIHGMRHEYPQARDAYLEALAVARKGGFTDHLVRCYQNLGNVMGDMGRPQEALLYQDSAVRLAREMGFMQGEADAIRERANILRRLSGDNPAYDELLRYLTLHDSILDTDKIKAVTEMREKYDTERKEKDNQRLRAANLAADLERERLQRVRNVYLFTGLVVLVAAIGLIGRLRVVNRSRRAIRKEKEVSEGLLHNILPEEVATELKAKGHADARHFDRITVLFTDFKGFTELSERLTPAQLVDELNTCFKAFDGIMEARGIEKIKTIGDAYMAAGGLPDPGRGSPHDTVLAALDMQDFMAGYRAEREEQGRPFFEMRVGLHTGPVIAGIVGVKKFAYDIWGDTVNTASRMESSGAPGHVNISRDTYELVKDRPDLAFMERGLVAAKGKGDMAMWYVERKA